MKVPTVYCERPVYQKKWTSIKTIRHLLLQCQSREIKYQENPRLFDLNVAFAQYVLVLQKALHFLLQFMNINIFI